MRLIDADRLLSEKMKSKYYHLPNGDIAIPLIDIEHAPTIEERKSGKWIRIRKEADGNTLYECSECHKGDTHYESVTVRFCWNCGAKMEGCEA